MRRQWYWPACLLVVGIVGGTVSAAQAAEPLRNFNLLPMQRGTLPEVRVPSIDALVDQVKSVELANAVRTHRRTGDRRLSSKARTAVGNPSGQATSSARVSDDPKFLSYPIAGMSGCDKFDCISVG